TVRVLGKPITEIAQEKGLDLAELDQEARAGGFKVFHGKKYTNYGVSTAAVYLANTIMNNALTELPVSNYREEYGTYLSYPAIVGRDGIVEQLQLELTKEELAKLQTSADYIKTKYAESR
ncbi:MAG: L-lactate dehydrogenase, partial [Bacillota bacterium]|nr:L-lactate dehydrogenase [Bacillota bacterium]